MLSVLPLTVSAQQEPPHVLIGTATLNGATPPIGTEVAAMEGGTKLGSTTTTAGGKFTLQVQRPRGRVVTFTVSGVAASESLTNWQVGKIQPGFTLTASAAVRPAPTATPVPSNNRGPAGPVGPPGAPGSQGAPGPQDAPGPQGAPGPSGRPGSSGRAGPSGRPGSSGRAGSPGRARVPRASPAREVP